MRISSQTEGKITFFLCITVEAGRGERKSKRGSVSQGGRGGGASVGEADGCVLT